MTHWHYCPGCSQDYKCDHDCDHIGPAEPSGRHWGIGYPCSDACREKIRAEDEARERERRIQDRRRSALSRLSSPKLWP